MNGLYFWLGVNTSSTGLPVAETFSTRSVNNAGHPMKPSLKLYPEYTQIEGPFTSARKASQECVNKFQIAPDRLGIYKVQVGFGCWAKVHAFHCPHCGKVIHMRINWVGSTPAGGFYCPHCSKVVGFNGQAG